MSRYPQNVTVHVSDDGLPQRLTVGDYELNAKHIAADIWAERLVGAGGKPSVPPAWKLWLPIRVEGAITDPSGTLRVVHEGDIDPFSNARPGPCGHEPDLPVEWGQPPPFCSLDAGHAGCHKDEERGTVWREVQ